MIQIKLLPIVNVLVVLQRMNVLYLNFVTTVHVQTHQNQKQVVQLHLVPKVIQIELRPIVNVLVVLQRMNVYDLNFVTTVLAQTQQNQKQVVQLHLVPKVMKEQ